MAPKTVYPLKNLANFSRTIEGSDIKLYILVTYSIICTGEKFRHIFYITVDLLLSQHIGEITAKAYRRANCILKCFASRDNDLYVRAFVVYVRPILEYNNVVWSPWLKQDIDQIEKVSQKISRNEGFKLL